ncbi:hypothetical protein HT031_000538 [Scenedesmus sp. PABB004]|nr:hypothetical protein HT031_000538 [Scenedesmus sp. PABB004]
MALALRAGAGSARAAAAPTRRRSVAAGARKQQQAAQQAAQPGSSAAAPAPAPGAEASTSAPAAPEQAVTREFRALGSKVVETNAPFRGPEDAPDFWEGERFEAFGKALESYFLPGLVVLGLVCGGIAAKTYNEDATTYIKPPTGPDAQPSIIIATPEATAGGAAAPSLVGGE